MLVTLVGGALRSGSANTLNCYIDRDIDAVMKRTSRRPLVAKGPPAAVKQAEALVSGILLGLASTLLLGFMANWCRQFWPMARSCFTCLSTRSA